MCCRSILCKRRGSSFAQFVWNMVGTVECLRFAKTLLWRVISYEDTRLYWQADSCLGNQGAARTTNHLILFTSTQGCIQPNDSVCMWRSNCCRLRMWVQWKLVLCLFSLKVLNLQRKCNTHRYPGFRLSITNKCHDFGWSSDWGSVSFSRLRATDWEL